MASSRTVLALRACCSGAGSHAYHWVSPPGSSPRGGGWMSGCGHRAEGTYPGVKEEPCKAPSFPVSGHAWSPVWDLSLRAFERRAWNGQINGKGSLCRGRGRQGVLWSQRGEDSSLSGMVSWGLHVIFGGNWPRTEGETKLTHTYPPKTHQVSALPRPSRPPEDLGRLRHRQSRGSEHWGVPSGLGPGFLHIF